MVEPITVIFLSGGALRGAFLLRKKGEIFIGAACIQDVVQDLVEKTQNIVENF